MYNSFKNPYALLIQQLKDELEKINIKTDQLLFRISMQADLKRVQEFGSSRLGLSRKIWDKLEEYKNKNITLPKPIIYHEEMIIASVWQDKKENVLLDNRTFKYKLKIYEKPFFTLYKKEKLQEVAKEE